MSMAPHRISESQNALHIATFSSCDLRMSFALSLNHLPKLPHLFPQRTPDLVGADFHLPPTLGNAPARVERHSTAGCASKDTVQQGLEGGTQGHRSHCHITESCSVLCAHVCVRVCVHVRACVWCRAASCLWRWMAVFS